MTDTKSDPTDPVAWVTQAGLSGAPELDLLRGFCERAVAAGLPISRGQVLIDTLHPVHEGRIFRWRADQAGIFQPANSNMSPIIVRRSEFKSVDIIGIVVGVYRKI